MSDEPEPLRINAGMYPMIEGFEPVWAVGDSKPRFYVSMTGSGEQRETPDYITWRGPWEQHV